MNEETKRKIERERTMKNKKYRILIVIVTFLIVAIIVKPLITYAQSSKIIQIDKMKLEFRDKETVILKEVVSKNKDTLKTISYNDIKKIIVAEGIKKLPDGMFERFPNVETISLPSTLTDFESGTRFEGAFKWYYYSYSFNLSLEKLKSITVSSKNKTYKSIDGVLFSKDGKSIIHYPKEKKTSSFKVPDTVETIYIRNKYIKEITVGANVKDFSSGYLPSLTSYKVSSKNKVFIAVNGVLFSKDKSILLKYPRSKGTEYAVPKGTKKIDRNAFRDSNIKNVTLPEGLLSISSYAFEDTKISSITLPKSLSILHPDAFHNSTLSHVHVNKQNGILSSRDGILYNKDQSLLIYWPEARVEENLKFADTLKVLDLSQIKTLEQSKSITIPKALNSILNTQNNQFSEITITDGNTSFVLNQGILYSSNMTMIKLYPNQNPITDIVLPDNVIYLDYAMFLTENTTTSLTLSKNLRYIQSVEYIDILPNKYSGFYHLTEVLIPEENPYFTSIDGVLYTKDMKTLQWYPQNSPNSTYSIPQTVTSIEQMQLINAANLVELNIPANLQFNQLMYGIFNSFSYVERVIGTASPKLERINVDSDNAEIKSMDGVLYSKEGTYLLLYPSAKKDKKFTVPDGVRSINSMTYNLYLEELVLSKGSYQLYENDPNVYNSKSNYNPFIHFTALKKFSFADGITGPEVKDGVLYDQYGTSLVAYPVAKEEKSLQLSSNIKYIQCESNLAYADSLQEILISDHEYFISKKGSLYYYDGELFLTPGSKTDELKEYEMKFLHMNDSKLSSVVKPSEDTSTNTVKNKDLVDFTLPDTYYAYKGNKNPYAGEKTVYIIDDVNPLTNYFKKTADAVETVIIAEGVMKIPELVFSLFPNVKEFNIPSTCNGIDSKVNNKYAYLGGMDVTLIQAFPKLCAVNVAPENDWFTSRDGVLYDRLLTKLFVYPANKINRSYVVPDSVGDLSGIIASNKDGSDYTNSYLKEITLGAYASSPPYYFIKKHIPNLETVYLNPYNLYFSISKGKLVTMQAYRQ